MNILFLHRNFPAQFRHLLQELVKDENNTVVFVTNNGTTPPPDGVTKVVYELKRNVPDNCHRYTRFFEEAINHGQAAAEALLWLQEEGFHPDIIIGHSWGSSLFVKEVFPHVPYIAYVEWYFNYKNSDIDFGNKEIDVDEKAGLTCCNAHLLMDLVKSDCVLCPTQWQKAQIPREFWDKVVVLHDGIDTGFCRPDPEARLKVPKKVRKKKLILSPKDEVLTYATRGMEPYRGFPQFMEAVSILQKQRPNLQVVIGGEDRVCYDNRYKGDTFAENGSFKKKMLKDFNYDMRRLHFTGFMQYSDYVRLLQVSSVYVYLTYPFVLSWSFLEAMAAECCIIASDTPPVTEFMCDMHNGILTDFFDVKALVAKINDALDHREKYMQLRKNARDTIINHCELRDMIAKQVALINRIANQNKR